MLVMLMLASELREARMTNDITSGLLTPSQLSCSEPGIDYWYNVLRYGQRFGRDYLPDGDQQRRVAYLVYGQSVYAFLFMYPDEPGAREQGAWHGCAIYRLYRLSAHRPQ